MLDKIITSMLLIAAAYQPLFSQESDSLCIYTLSGYVIDEHDKTPLAFAAVLVKETGKSAVGDSTGFYEIKGICKGEYTVICQHIGCETLEIKIKIKGTTQENFYPEHHAEEIKEVWVSAEKLTKAETQSRESMGEKELDESAGKNLGETLKEITGVSTLQSGPTISKPVIHGLHSNRILIINNGIRQEDQQWGAEHAPDIDPFVASRITVVKGAGTVKYGSDAIGGIILVDPAPLPTGAEFSGAIHAVEMTNGWQSCLSGHLQGGIKKWNGFGWRIQGTGKISGDLHAPDYNLSNTGSREAGVSATLGLKRVRFNSELYYSFLYKDLTILRASHTGNLTDLENAINSEQPWYIEDFTFDINNPRQKIIHHLLKLKAQTLLNNNWRLEAQYGFQFNNRQEFDIRRGGRSDIPAIDLQLQTHTVNLDLESISANNFRTSIGIAGFYQRNHNVPGTGIRPLIPNYQSASGGAYFVERYVKEKWEAEAGVRYDYKFIDVLKYDRSDSLIKSNFGFHNFSANLGAIGLWHDFTLRSNVGLSYRPPTVNELFSEGLHHGAAAIEDGDENLNIEKGFKWVASIDYRHDDIADIRLLGYYDYILDYIYLDPQDEFRLTIRGAFPVFDYVHTDASLAGIDFSARIRTIPNLFLKSKISFIRARDISNDDYLISIPSNRFENAVAYEREKWGKTKDVSFSFGVLNVLKQNRVPEGKDFMPPPDAYFLLNFSAGCTIPFGNKNKLGLQFSVENFLNKSYRDYMNRFRYYADEAGRNFTLRIHYSF